MLAASGQGAPLGEEPDSGTEMLSLIDWNLCALRRNPIRMVCRDRAQSDADRHTLPQDALYLGSGSLRDRDGRRRVLTDARDHQGCPNEIAHLQRDYYQDRSK